MICLILVFPASCYTSPMKPETRAYFLKEYGSWSVLFVAYTIGLGVGSGFRWEAVLVLLALSLLINSKQAFTKWMRGTSDRKPLIILLAHIVAAAIILLAVFGKELPRLLPLLIVPAAYLLMNIFAGEHFVLTELLGFALLSLAAVLAKFLITGGLDARLFVGVALYFGAGVFKVKAMLLKKTRDRTLAALYPFFAVPVYLSMNLPLIALLPLADNVVAAVTPYKARLRTIGWIEVVKSLLFLVLFVYWY